MANGEIISRSSRRRQLGQAGLSLGSWMLQLLPSIQLDSEQKEPLGRLKLNSLVRASAEVTPRMLLKANWLAGWQDSHQGHNEWKP